MTRRLTIDWPAEMPVPAGTRLPLRLLAVSDERDPGLEQAQNRAEIGKIDAVLGCGDLEPDYLCFLGDAFRVPLLYVKGNHDHGQGWAAGTESIPRPLGAAGQELAGINVRGLSWPGDERRSARRDEGAGWGQSARLYLRARLSSRPHIILSHVPPRGLGDAQADPYHTGFTGYRWLCGSLRPILWLHGHTTLASAGQLTTQCGSTTLVNVTGAVLIQIDAAAGG
jgi:hypothetical protein